jgi:predicted metal-dependent peptidase
MSTQLEKGKGTLLLDLPLFACVLLQHPMSADNSIKTLCINGKGAIRYNPDFIEAHTVDQVTWALCHEVLHYMGMDALRVGDRDREVWNIVADQWINDYLAKHKIGQPIDGCISLPGASDLTRETLYENEMRRRQEKQEQESKPGNGKPEPGAGKPQPGQAEPGTGKPQPGNGGDPMGGDIEYKEMSGSEIAEQEGVVKLEVAQALQAAKSRGALPGGLQELVSSITDSKVPWYNELERLMTERLKNAVSWMRPNRRYLPDYYLPTYDGIGKLGEIVIQIDISGSITAKETEHYNGHLKRIVEECQPAKVHVLYTDTKVQKHEVFENPEELEIKYQRGGGTKMEAGFAYLKEQDIEPAVMITLTDAEDNYTTTGPDYPVVWCVSGNRRAPPYGHVIRFSLT